MISSRLSLIAIKARLSGRTIISFLTKERIYALAIPITAVIYFETMFWLSNISVFRTIMMSPRVSLADKLNVLSSPVAAIHQASGLPSLIVMIGLSVVQAVVLVLLVFVIKHQRSAASNELGRSLFASTLVLIGIGCPACGTSLITPIITLFAASSAVTLAEQITAIILPLALLVSIYGLYELGLKTATIYARRDINGVTAQAIPASASND